MTGDESRPTELEQKAAALARANEVRHRRAEFKQRVHAGQVTLEQLLDGHPPDWLRTAPVYGMLLEIPRVGPVTARNAMSRAEVPGQVTFERLRESWRRRLLDELSRTVARRWL
jgi:hypothetical protein